MNRERAKELLPIIEHFANGGAIQYRHTSIANPTWHDALDGQLDNLDELEYRIKPEPREFYLYLKSHSAGEWDGSGPMYVTHGGLEKTPTNAIKVVEVLDE